MNLKNNNQGIVFIKISNCKQETMNKVLQLYFKDDKTRASGDAVLLMAEMLKVFVREASARAARQAQTEDVMRVEVEHVEKILPQLVCTTAQIP